MKRKLVIFLILILTITSFSATFAHKGTTEINISIDGKTVLFPDEKPFINADSRVLTPVRFVAEALGGEVKWLEDTSTVVLTIGSTEIRFNIGESIATVNDVEISFDTSAQIINRRTYVPVRFISEVLGNEVEWEPSTDTVLIFTKEHKTFLSDSELEIYHNLNEYLRALESNRNFNGSVLVAQNDNIILSKGYGKSNIEKNISNTSTTKHPIGSITKQFTAFAIMQLYEEGKIGLDDTLSMYFPEYGRGDEITIEHLLVHSSGIINYTDYPSFYSLKPEEMDIENIMALFELAPLKFEPGTNWSYSNSGYLLLGYIVEMVSGMSLDIYFDEKIFKPLNMANTGIAYKNSEKMFDSIGYTGNLTLSPISDRGVLSGAYGAGYLISTVEDLYLWDRSLNTEELISNEINEMIFHSYMPIQNDIGYGLGWFIQDHNELGKVAFHGGNVPGFSAFISRFFDIDLVIIITTNQNAYEVEALFNQLFLIVSGVEVPLPEKKQNLLIEPTKIFERL
ncbi:CubicO group peptidase (beta-lactamase class C family) [Natranaerovirga pectinivora]|uniref:CubicO group peptidase (Beta-lactamase class C family) n=1 Tax=Natranaerovirga pectinivora TaxID=682400 RepID=A0A4R3MQI3_9FIRM|nr:serine hydrolase [Natranaerovirga pectinivora]TCT15431.1 CubicO group peptidase (beta-lactamase class C family) [Natranaerovirga pectinivora]